jgi:hypothetical protein
MKYLSLILLLLFITIVSTCTGCYKREGLDNKDAMIAGGYVNVGNRSGNCAPSIIPGKNNFATKELASQFCFDWNKKGGNPVCTAIEEHAGKFTARGCSDDAIKKGWCKGFPKVSFQEEKCNTEQGGTTWFYKKPPHTPLSMNQHISHIQNPIISHGEFNSPLPQQKATFISDKSR